MRVAIVGAGPAGVGPVVAGDRMTGGIEKLGEIDILVGEPTAPGAHPEAG